MNAAEEVFQSALHLTLNERADIAKRLLDTLDETASSDPTAHQRAWTNEIARRADEIVSGKVSPVPADDVFARARSRLRPP